MRNKKAQFSKQLMIFPFLFLIIIIGVGIALGVGIYYGSGYDARQADADILLNKIENCAAQNSFSNIKNNFYNICGINETVLENNKFILRICKDILLNDCAAGDKSEINIGSNFQTCVFEGAKANSAFPRCSTGEVASDGGRILIIAGSNQQIRRINT